MKKISLCVITTALMFGCGYQQEYPYEWIIEPTFADVHGFSEGLAAAKINDKWGFVDKNGTFVIDAQFDEASSFSEGMALVSPKGTMWNGDGKWGFIDKTGKFVIEPEYTKMRIGISSDKRWIREATLNDETGYLDNRGNFTKEIPRLHDDTIHVLRDNVPVDLLKFDIDGKIIEPPVEPDYIFPPFSESLARAVSKEKWGFVDMHGKWVIKPVYNDVYGFSEGLALVQKQDGLWDFIDKEGEVILSSYTDPLPFSEGLAVACKRDHHRKSHYGYIDKSGNWVIKPQFEKAYSFTDSAAFVQKKNKWGIIKLK